MEGSSTLKQVVQRGSLVLLTCCGIATACGSDGDGGERERDPADGVDIPVRTPVGMTPSDEDMPTSPFPPDEPQPTTRPPVVIPPTDDTVANGTSPRGGSCSMNADCVPGLSCVTAIGQSTAGVQSIAGGYCSSACSDDDDCAAVGAGSFCYIGIFGLVTGFCTAPCEASRPEAEKCNGRTDLVCYAGAGEVGSCNPTCGRHEQCGAAAYCGFGTAQCQSTPLNSFGTRVGGLCPAGEPVTCNGFCVAETDQDGICTGPCRLGSPCGNDPALRCVPSDPALRRGDFGMCERACTSTADCTPGIAVCAPTGFSTSGGEPERTCSYALPTPSTLNQRLSVEELALATTPAGPIGVTAFTPGATVFRLSAGDSGVCVAGTLAAGSPVVLVFQFGSNDGAPFDASAFAGFAIEHSSALTVGLQAQLSNQPGLFYRNEIAEGLSFPIAAGASSVPFSEMAPLDVGAAPWDPAQLEAVRLVVGSNAPAGPFEACVQRLGFE